MFYFIEGAANRPPLQGTWGVMDIGRTVRRWRKRAGLSQEQLAARTGAHQPQIARIEAGRQSPRIDTLAAILAVCGARLRVEPRREPVDAPPPPARPATPKQALVLRQLAFRRVDCVVTGPLAERLRGADVRAPEAVTILARREVSNHRRLALVRRDLGLPLRRGAILRIRFSPPFPFTSYEEVAERAGATEHGNVPVLSLDQLIEARRTPRDPKAREALELLLHIRDAHREAED